LRAASWDVDSWLAAVETVLARKDCPAPELEPVRRWADVADETISAIRTR
jgi:hypothetical protein